MDEPATERAIEQLYEEDATLGRRRMPVLLQRRYGIEISMDGKGRWADNIIMERFWRTYKHEFFLHREPKSLEEAIEMTSEWMEYYNRERPHSSLKNYSPLMYRENRDCPLPANF